MSNQIFMKLGSNIDIDIVHNLSQGFLPIVGGCHGNEEKGITMVTDLENQNYENSLTQIIRNSILNIW